MRPGNGNDQMTPERRPTRKPFLQLGRLEGSAAHIGGCYTTAMTNFRGLFKSFLQNIGVVAAGLVLAYLGTKIDSLFGIANFRSAILAAAGSLLTAIGFFIRVWATFYFYVNQIKVISLVPQRTLVTSGPLRFSQNPLYLGGNVFIFFGAALLLGSPIALLFTAIHLPLIDPFIRREEKQPEQTFGEEWVSYKNQVSRWI
jgi:protein-S-isoprenylcysteine O-methyltransferase Ste14